MSTQKPEYDAREDEYDGQTELDDSGAAETRGVPYEPEERGVPEGELADLPHQAAGSADRGDTADISDTADTAVTANTTDAAAADTEDTADASTADPSEPLLASTSAEAFLDRWSDIQATFIEDPQESVAEADALLTEVLTAYQQAVEQRREHLSSTVGNTADTEKMRLALLDYRTIITTMLPTQSVG